MTGNIGSRLVELAGVSSPADSIREPSIRQPSWLPDWAWREYLTVPGQYLSNINAERSALVMETLDRLVHCQECADVWKTFERRKSDADRIWNRRLQEAAERMHKSGLSFDGHAPSVLWELSDIATSAISGFRGSVRYTAKKRKQAATRINKTIHKLFCELDELQADGGAIPFAVRQALAAWGKAHGAQGAFTDIRGVLGAFGEGIREWSAAPPFVARPNDPNAHRLFFIRQMTRWCQTRYGMRLRGTVLSLTGVFFDCSDLDESAISKLAPE